MIIRAPRTAASERPHRRRRRPNPPSPILSPLRCTVHALAAPSDTRSFGSLLLALRDRIEYPILSSSETFKESSFIFHFAFIFQGNLISAQLHRNDGPPCSLRSKVTRTDDTCALESSLSRRRRTASHRLRVPHGGSQYRVRRRMTLFLTEANFRTNPGQTFKGAVFWKKRTEGRGRPTRRDGGRNARQRQADRRRKLFRVGERGRGGEITQRMSAVILAGRWRVSNDRERRPRL